LASESEQVRALQQSILERARELSAGHVAQGEMTRNKILEDAHEKVKLMEQKELLAGVSKTGSGERTTDSGRTRPQSLGPGAIGDGQSNPSTRRAE
jgi:hypothetical protein